MIILISSVYVIYVLVECIYVLERGNLHELFLLSLKLRKVRPIVLRNDMRLW